MARSARLIRFFGENLILLSLVAIVAFFGFASERFFSVTTLSTLLNQLPALTVVAIG